MFRSPESTEKAEAMPVAAVAMDRRRPGNKNAPLEKGELHQALGFGTKPQKKPASALGKGKKAGAEACWCFGKGAGAKDAWGENQENCCQEVKPQSLFNRN